MKATNAYAAKRALLDYLATVAPFTGTDAVQIQYARDDRYMERRCVYGGGARFVQTQESAEWPGPIRSETVTTGLYVRVAMPGLSVRETEETVEGIADAVAAALAANPELAGGLTFEQLVGGTADFYAQDADRVEAILSMSCQIESHLT